MGGVCATVTGTMAMLVTSRIAHSMGGWNARSTVSVIITLGSAGVHLGGRALLVSALECSHKLLSWKA